MVEKLQEGKSAPTPETEFHVLETTLAELGVDTSVDNLGLASDRLTLGMKKVGKEAIFIGFLHHPLAGEHLAQFLDKLAPSRQDRIGIINDVNLPILANRDIADGKDAKNSGYIFLHERHLNDPRVQAPYRRFAEDHADAWLCALNNNPSGGVFEIQKRIRFIKSKDSVKKEFFPEDGSFTSENVAAIVIEALHGNSKFRNAAADLLSPLEEGNNTALIGNAESLLRGLTREEQEELAIRYQLGVMDYVLADLETHTFLNKTADGNLAERVWFVDGSDDVVISNGVAKVVISPLGGDNAVFNGRAMEYSFPETYVDSSLFSVVVWKKDKNGKRVFLTQKEAMPFVEELGLPHGTKGDAKLGEIAVGIFSPEITRNWEKEMTLKPLDRIKSIYSMGDDFKQPMRGGNMGGWIAIERHREELLQSDVSILAALEKYAGAFT